MVHSFQCGSKEKVAIGNDSELLISVVGSSYLPSNDRLLDLENILCVPAIANNLVSVSKLAQDNNVYLEFHVDSCSVKRTLVQEKWC